MSGEVFISLLDRVKIRVKIRFCSVSIRLALRTSKWEHLGVARYSAKIVLMRKGRECVVFRGSGDRSMPYFVQRPPDMEANSPVSQCRWLNPRRLKSLHVIPTESPM